MCMHYLWRPEEGVRALELSLQSVIRHYGGAEYQLWVIYKTLSHLSSPCFFIFITRI